MSPEQFLDWVETREGRWEFDGCEPVATPRGPRNHSQVAANIILAVGSRLRGGPCRVLGADAAIAVRGDGVRYPDALVTCTPGPGTDRVVPGPVVVFEVVSPTSGRTDRIVKLGEYRAVPTIRRYVILESTTAALTSLERAGPDAPWTANGLTEADMLEMPEIGIGVPVAEFFEGAVFEPGTEEA